jgi:DNA-directed RNA polymerase subunit RPC12/RpoP
LLLSLPWLLLIGGGISMCVLYEPGEQIGTLGYTILTIMLFPQLVLIGMLLWAGEESGFGCALCGRQFYSRELAKILLNGQCPGCGQSVPKADLEDGE